jgi:hypothetical protein
LKEGSQEAKPDGKDRVGYCHYRVLLVVTTQLLFILSATAGDFVEPLVGWSRAAGEGGEIGTQRVPRCLAGANSVLRRTPGPGHS